MKNKILFLTVLSILVLSGIIMVNANNVYVANGISFNTPLASGTISGNTLFNLTNVTSLFNYPVNCSIYAKSSSSANTSWSLLGIAINRTLTAINGTFSTLIIEDSNDYSLNATCRNTTNDITDTIITGIIVNNTNPASPSGLSPLDFSSVTASGTQSFTSTVIDANTTSCTYTIYRGGGSSDGESGSTTYSVSTCSFTKAFSTTPDNGEWFWCITSSDGSDTARTCATLSVQIPNAGGGAVQDSNDNTLVTATSTNPATEEKNNTLWIVGAIIIIFIIGIVMYNNKK